MEEGSATAGEDTLTALRQVKIPDKLLEEEAEGGSVDDIGGKGAASKLY